MRSSNAGRRSTGRPFRCSSPHGGSGKQARAVIDGLEADVVTLALAYDIDVIEKIRGGLVGADWQQRLPNHGCPYYSTIVFLVRNGNPKAIKDWDDLVRDGVKVITPNPQTSGGARWNYLAAWGYVLKKELGDWGKLREPAAVAQVDAAQKKARQFVARLFANVPVLDTGARGATNTFTKGTGDVLIAWENEALVQTHRSGDKFEIVTPSISIRAEPPVAVVEKIAQRHDTLEVAQAYLQFLYSPVGQEIGTKHYYRPISPEIAGKVKGLFPSIEMFSIDVAFQGWDVAQRTHFDDGGVFDQIYKQ